MSTDTRLEFDYRVISEMASGTSVFEFVPYESISDLRSGRSYDGSSPAAYKVTFYVPTLVGEGSGTGEFVDTTDMAIDLRAVGYPVSPPNVTVLTRIPYSPHFKQNFPVCIGSEAWTNRTGHVTLGHLVIHLAKLLNWDEEMRGGGYVGWNAAAIAFHQRVFGGRVLNRDLSYPALPSFLSGNTGGRFKPARAKTVGFQPAQASTAGFEPRKSSFSPR